MFSTLAFWASGDKSLSENSATDKSELSFNVVYDNNSGDNLRSNAASFNCDSQGISTVEAKVYDQDYDSIADGSPWDCKDSQGTITSVPTGSGLTVMILAKDADGNIIFSGQKALYYCETLELAGFDDWRLPNQSQLRSIVSYEKGYSEQNHNIYETFFPNAIADKYWTATTHPGVKTYAKSVSFQTGTGGRVLKSDSLYVRAVRGGH